MAAVTRLGLYGGPQQPYGSFSGKTEFTDPTVERKAGRKLLNPNSLVAEPTAFDIRRALVDLWYIASPFSAPQDGDYTTTGKVAHERVIMTNSSAASVILHSQPADLDRVTVKRTNAQVTVLGNVNKIDGASQQILTVQYASIELLYTEAANEWSIL